MLFRALEPERDIVFPLFCERKLFVVRHESPSRKNTCIVTIALVD
uniref:Uncharacterized protein n=1 Tax=Lactiplantibacillus plantarum TaxID=1590 RepID=K4K5W8_LACPN|nr:hypothetical protein [Lactiplantibacillus plantarum]